MQRRYAASQTQDLSKMEKIPDQRRTNEGLLRRIRDDGLGIQIFFDS
jgi:hypothetical protein